MATQMTKYHSIKYNDWNKVNLICEQLVELREELLESLGVEYQMGGRMIYGACPVHGGDKYNAFNWYNNGKWVCYTHNCHNHFKDTPIGLLRGLLSHIKYDWCQEGDTKYGWDQTVEFALKFLHQDYGSIEIDLACVERRRFGHQVDIITKQTPKANTGISRETIRSSLVIPAKYYLERGYDAKTLDRFDVGYCAAKGKQMSWRVVVPIYDGDDNFVGCTGRSIFKQCQKCSLFHSEQYACPEEQYMNRYTKWKHSYGFDRENYFYNLNNAKEHIAKTGVAILVESPGNVWRLEEAGIHNSLACFGASLTEGQKYLLDGTGAMSIITIGDNDEGGVAFCKDIEMKCSRTYRLYFPKFKIDSDIGEIKVDAVTADIKPFLEQIEKCSL